MRTAGNRSALASSGRLAPARSPHTQKREIEAEFFRTRIGTLMTHWVPLKGIGFTEAW
jgi:hypothetical protein